MAISEIEADATFLNIIMDLRNDITTLMRQEAALVKSEIKGKAEGYLKTAVFMGASACLGLFAAFFLLLAVSKLLMFGLTAAGLPVWEASWISPLGLGCLLALGALLLLSKSRLQRESKPRFFRRPAFRVPGNAGMDRDEKGR